MTEPMSDARLARLAADNEPVGDHLSGLTADEVAEILTEVARLRAELDAAAALLVDHLSSEECWIEYGRCIKHGSSIGEPCRMPLTRELLKRIHAIQLHPYSAAAGCVYPGCAIPNHKPRTWDYPVGG